MATKDKAIYVAEKGEWQIQRRDSKGNTRVTDSIGNIEHLPVAKAVQIFAGFAKEQKNLRDGALSLLADIMVYGKDAMNGYKGTAKPDANMPNQLKDTFRDLESAFFKQFMNPEHDDHADFVKRLPKQDERGNEFLVLGKPNDEARFQYFLTVLRKAPSYANAKNTVLSFWAYCGQGPLASDNTIIPPEVMRTMVAEVRDVKGPDNSYKARLMEIHREWISESKNPADDDMPTIVHLLTELLSHAQTRAKVVAELATVAAERRKSVSEQTNKALESARATLNSTTPEVKESEKA